MSRSVRVALFDVDGTLVDTNYLHAVTWWEAFTQAGHQPAMADIHRAIGMGSDQMLDKLLPAGRDKDTHADVRAAHSTLYATYWSRLTCSRLCPAACWADTMLGSQTGAQVNDPVRRQELT
jgi:phosphoglycolate phosphatase-like HAD superfamily hydrolase